MDDPNITIEEYIRLQEEKAQRHALSCEPTVSPLNENKIDFIISFDESDDEDYTDEGDHEGKKLAGTLIDIPILVGNFSIISGFTIIDDMDVTCSVVLGMLFCKKFMSCQKIMEKFARGDEYERMDEE
ncbi:hypothetical protein Tco_1242185 [Tanacetum coccineum]